MLYFWLTNAVHQANRASMESMDLHLGQFNPRKNKKNKKQKSSSDKLKKKFQSEPDLSYGASIQNNCCSNCGGAVGQNWPIGQLNGQNGQLNGQNGQNSKRRASATVSNMSLSSSSS